MALNVEWEQLNPEQACAHLAFDNRVSVYFADGTSTQFPNIRMEKPTNTKNACAKYIAWLFPGQDLPKVTDSLINRLIDIRRQTSRRNTGGYQRQVIYFFRRPGFFRNTLSTPAKKQQFDLGDYSAEYCLKHGSYVSTAVNVIAFYYLRILPAKQRKNVYINRYSIYVPYVKPAHDFVPLYVFDIYTFLKATPVNGVGISFMQFFNRNENSHLTLLVFDYKARRLEMYDPNGVDAVYVGDTSTGLYLYESLMKYNYIFQNRADQPNLLVCSLWASRFEFQQSDSSCSLWSSAMAICRMAGVGRDQLPIKTQDVLEITEAIRRILLHGCRFEEFTESDMTYSEVDRALENCTVRPDEKERLQDLVMRHATKTPIPIPADVDLCFGVVDYPCKNHLTINVNEVDVNLYFMEYVKGLCQLNHVTVLLPDVVTYFDALNLIASRMNQNGHLELACSVDINSPLTMDKLRYLLLANQTLHVSSRDAIVHDGNFARFPQRLRFGRVLVEQSIPSMKMVQLQAVSDSIVGEVTPRIQPEDCQQVVINLLDPDLKTVVDYWTKHCYPGTIERVICEGHGAGPETCEGMSGPPTHLMNKILDLGQVVEIPSICSNDDLFYQQDLHGAHLHVKEVAVDNNGIDEMWKFIQDGSLTVGRWVLMYDGPSDVEDFNAVVEKLDHQPNVYILLRDVSIQSLQIASKINVRKYVVDERFRGDPMIAQLPSQDVEFRNLG